MADLSHGNIFPIIGITFQREESVAIYQMMFLELGANFTVHSWMPSVLLVDVSGRRSRTKHVVWKSERTLDKTRSLHFTNVFEISQTDALVPRWKTWQKLIHISSVEHAHIHVPNVLCITYIIFRNIQSHQPRLDRLVQAISGIAQTSFAQHYRKRKGSIDRIFDGGSALTPHICPHLLL